MKKFNYFFSSALLSVILFASVAVMGQNPFYIDVLQPDNTSLDWVVGETYTISWTDNLSQPVEVWLWDVSLAGGAAYRELTPSSGVTGTTWSWAIPNNQPVATGYKIKVQSHVSPATYQNVGHTFDLVYTNSAHPITVLQPSANNISWAWNTIHLISWKDNINEAVDVLISDASGSFTSPNIIGTSVTGTTMSWTVPTSLAKGTGYKIKVRSHDFPNDVLDVSDHAFAITQATGTIQQIYQPNSTSLKWSKSSIHRISWRDDISEPVDIYVYDFTASGTEYLIGNHITGSTFVWDLGTNLGTGGIPWVPDHHYKIDIMSSVDHSIHLEGNYFTITSTNGTISTIYEPKNNSSWTVETKHLISWLDDLTEPVDVFYKIGGSEYLIQSNVTGTTCYWTIPAVGVGGIVAGTNNCTIIVKSSVDATVLKESSLFDLTLSTGTSITVLQPNVSGISWAQNTSHLISWNDNYPENSTIDLVESDGTTLKQHIVSGTGVSGSTYVWSIGSIAAGTYKIRVQSVDDPTGLSDVSNHTFNITLSAGTFVTVLDPNGGEYWMAGTSHLISWNDNCTENVYIQLVEYNSSGGVQGTTDIITKASGGVTGSTYTWDISSSATTGDYFKVRVASVLDETLDDYSNSYFHIVPWGKSPISNNGLSGDISNGVSVYPNPATGSVNIYASASISNIQVRNMLGQVLYSKNIGTSQTSIDISDFDAGLYIVNVNIEGNIITKKLFVK